MEHDFLSHKGGGGGRGVKKKHNGLGNVVVKDNVNMVSSVAKTSGLNDVNTPIVIMEKPLEPNMGSHLNDTKLKGDMTRKSVNFRTLVAPAENGADVAISLSSYARAIIELRADGELKDTIMVAMPKLAGEGFNLCTIRVRYEWKPPRCSSCKVFGHVLNEGFNLCTIRVVMKNPRQATRFVLVSPKGLKVTKGQRPFATGLRCSQRLGLMTA
ncbi:hypothetical protein Tco_0368986 [Tanacetum coccineum]